jgi:hypothetical protein
MFVMRSSVVRGALAVLALSGMMATQAQARIFIGLGLPLFLPPVVVPAPYYYPPYYGPPAVYAPPGNSFNYAPPGSQPQSLAAPQSYAPAYTPGGYTPSNGGEQTAGGAQSCQAGAYVCPLVEDTPPGGACSCPGHNGQHIRGQAN